MKSMNMTRFLMCCCLGLTLTMTAGCIPGKAKEKQVLAKTDEARKSVQAEKAAADLAGIAQRLVASTDVAADITNTELHTTRCGDKIFAYVPRTASITNDGALAQPIAQRMRTDLEKRFKPERVRNSENVNVTCVDLEKVALNSPILELDNSFASAAEAPKDSSAIVKVDVTKCDNNRPGVLIKNLDIAGNVISTIDKCGSSIAPDADEITVTTTSVPDWRKQLELDADGNQINPGAMTNFTCIVDGNACKPISSKQIGTNITCPDSNDQEELVANPIYNAATATFVSKNEKRDCGRGWVGTMTAHIQKKTCSVNRSGTTTIPATIIDVAYVGAECEKAKTATVDSCPVGFTFSENGGVAKEESLYMTGPLLMQPAKQADDSNVSSIAFKETLNGVTTSNMDDHTVARVGKKLSVLTPTGVTTSKTFFHAITPLSNVATADFDQRFVDELRSMNKLAQMPGSQLKCFVKGQSCFVGETPSSIDITVDRSSQMSEAADVNIYEGSTYCDATMGNLFIPEKRVDACSAAKAYAAIAKNRDFKGYIDYHIVDGKDPVSQINSLIPGMENLASGDVREKLDYYKAITIGSLSNPVFRERLLYSMALGLECESSAVNTPFFLGKLNIFQRFARRDTFGSCAPEFISQALVDSGVFNDGAVLKRCQNTCPGSCVTDVSTRNAGNPVPVKAVTKMEATDLYLKNYMISRLPIKSRVTYAEFINNQVDGVETSAPGRTPIVLQDNQNLSTSNIVAVDPGYYWKDAKEKLDAKATARVDELGGGVKLYRSIDAAIDRLLKPKASGGGNLSVDPNTPASLIIFGSKFDNECLARATPWWEVALNFVLGNPLAFLSQSTMDYMTGAAFKRVDGEALPSDCTRAYVSKYFGRNICEPQSPPREYQCDACIGYWVGGICSPRPEWDSCAWKVFGACVGAPTTIRRASRDFTSAQVEAAYKYDTPGNRQKYCASQKSWGRELDTDLSINVTREWTSNRESHDAGIVTPDNSQSLVGFIGRYFPKTKIYYFDADGSGISKVCTGTNFKDYDATQPHIFHNKREVMKIFRADEDMGKFMKEAIENITGGGESDIAAGEAVCSAKFPGATVEYGTPAVLPDRVQTFDGIGSKDMACEGPVTMRDITLPADMPELPEPTTWYPPYIPPPVDPQPCGPTGPIVEQMTHQMIDDQMQQMQVPIDENPQPVPCTPGGGGGGGGGGGDQPPQME